MNYFTVYITTATGTANIQWNNFKALYPRAAKIMERNYRKFDKRSIDFNDKKLNITLV